MKYTNIVSISSGTMREQDLVPCFIEELRRHSPSTAEMRERDAGVGCYQAWITESDPDMSELLNQLFDDLTEYAPPYFYFGAHPGDGADYGFWLGEDFLDEFDELKVSDTSEVPDDHIGEVLEVNDHGNVTLYVADGNGNLEEQWAIV